MIDDAPRPTTVPLDRALALLGPTQAAHHALARAADREASILVVLAVALFAFAAAQGAVVLPIAILGLFAFVAAVLAILAMLPDTHPPRRAPFDLLYFGSFARLDRDQFEERLRAAIADDQAIVEALVTDVYRHGQQLARKKHRLLGFAYRVLLIGLTASFVAFVVGLF